ncbi:MAG: hypothetical protein ACRCTJ_05470 [Brevinema sp.]
MKKFLYTKFLFFYLLVPTLNSYSKADVSSVAYGFVPRLELGFTALSANIYYGAIDIDLGVIFYQKGTQSLAFKTTLFTYVPANIDFPQHPYILTAGLLELQYRISHSHGLYYSMETGIGVAGEIMTIDVFDANTDTFTKDILSTPYGLFSGAIRLGYDFEPIYKHSFKLSAMFGYRMQFPFNFTIKHFLIGGISLSYAFDLKNKAKSNKTILK